MLCHLCVKNQGTRVWMDWWCCRLLTCDTCQPENYNLDDCDKSVFLKPSKEYPWGIKNVVDPVADSFKCFDCGQIAPSKRGFLEHMALWMYGNVKLPAEFRFQREGREGEFLCCDACGLKRHAEGRSGRGVVTEDVAKFIASKRLA